MSTIITAASSTSENPRSLLRVTARHLPPRRQVVVVELELVGSEPAVAAGQAVAAARAVGTVRTRDRR
jgi:hypothetical protein